MIIEIEKIFKYRKPNRLKLIEYGFLEEKDNLYKKISILDNQFELVIDIKLDGNIKYKVIDNSIKEEYFLLKVSSANGKFVENIRKKCYEILIEISLKCFDMDIFQEEQTERIFSFIKLKYDIEGEYLFKTSPNVAVFRRKDNKKWFAVLMKLEGKKLGSIDRESIEVINIKSSHEKVKKLLEIKGVYPAYHMNKKHWITILLDRSILDDKIFKLILESYNAVGNKS